MSTFSFEFRSANQLPAATTLNDSDVLILQTAAGTMKVTLGQIRANSSSTLIPLTQKGAANGVATLDANSVIFDNQIPSTIARDSELSAGLATKADSSALNTHISNTSNPHGVTAAQVGAIDLTSAQTVSGVKTFSNGLTVGTAGISAAVSGFPNITLTAYNRPSSTECGFAAPLFKCTAGRFDLDPLDNKAEFRVSGASTQFNVYNTSQNLAYFTINSDRTVNLFNTLSVSGGLSATGSGSFNSLSLNTALPITSGGTGSNTATGARSNIGAASSGANSDITSITGLATPLSVAQGGTGVNSLSGFRSTIGAAASGANSDITALSGLTTAISIAQGGTGSTTAAGARTALSAAASGVNSDITRINGLNTPLSVAQGGTGASSASAARSNLGILGSKFTTITGNYTILPADIGNVFDCSVSAGASTFTLPSAASNQGFICTIRKTDSSANLITVACAGSDTINGVASIQLSQQFQALSLVSNGTTAWTVLSNQSTGANANQIQSRPVTSTAPTTGQVLGFNGTQWTPQAAGKVLQVVFAQTSTQIASSSSTLAPIGLSASITPLFSTSRILILASINGIYRSFSGGSNSVYLAWMKNGAAGQQINSGTTDSSANPSSVSGQFSETAGTTSPITYGLGFSNPQVFGQVFCQYFGTSTSSITIMEIAA